MSELPHDYHPEDIDRFARFNELAGIEIADPTERVQALSTIGAEAFLDRLSIANGLLSGEEKFTRWTGEISGATVSSPVLGTDLEPPDNAMEMFIGYFANLQAELEPSEEGLEKAAAGMYFAIIGAHIFEDGNGRLARSAYHLIRHGKLPDDQKKIIERQENTILAARNANTEAIKRLFNNEGYEKDKDYEYLDDLAADEEEEFSGIFVDRGRTQQLKYIAARRVMEQAGAWEARGAKLIGMKNWPENRLKEYQNEYATIRQDWYIEFIKTGEHFHDYFANLIDPVIAVE
ncbi:MAG: Fic family protein [bacterium]|nr:Fic family protein [bacterium]